MSRFLVADAERRGRRLADIDPIEPVNSPSVESSSKAGNGRKVVLARSRSGR